MKLKQLDGLMAFWKVAEHRGFTAAAAELEVSPSALSQAIRQLEARLGVRLLNRTTRSVSLTEAGEAYVARVGPAIGQVIEAGEELNVLQGRPAGTLRLNAARISIAMVLQPVLAGFLREHPHVQLELTNDEGFVDIVERGFDAGVRLGESVQRDMVAVPLRNSGGTSYSLGSHPWRSPSWRCRSSSVLPWLSAQTAWIRDDKIRKVIVIARDHHKLMVRIRSPLEPGRRSLISFKALSKMVWGMTIVRRGVASKHRSGAPAVEGVFP